MRVMGIDTGINGGIAVFEVADTPFFGEKLPPAECVVDICDIPTIDDEGSYRYVNARRLFKLIEKHRPDHVFMEAVRAMPALPAKGKKFRRSMGAASAMNFGDARGAIRASVTIGLGREPEVVEPQAWKKAFGLRGPDKEQSRQKALQRCPAAAPWLKRKTDHGRAEALLIAIYGASKLLGEARAVAWKRERGMLGAVP